MKHILVAVLLGGGAWLSAETVILNNGDRIECEILHQSPADISIRRLSDDGRVRFVQTIARSSIHAIEPGAIPELIPKAQSRPAEETDGPVDTRPAASRPAGAKVRTKVSTLAPADRQELLKLAIDQWRKQEYGSAGFNLSRLINNLNETDLAVISTQTEKALDMSLADLAAEAHFRAAIDVSRDRVSPLQYVTGYEKPYLIPRLVDAYEQALVEEVGVTGKALSTRSPKRTRRREESRVPETGPVTASQPATTRPSEPPSPRTVAAWLDRPEAFNLPRKEARPFARQVIFAAKLISEIARLDSETRANRNRLEELTRSRRKLYTLYRVAIARAGGALTPEEREAQQAGIEEQQERLRKIVELNQRRQQEMMEKAIQIAKERGALPADAQVPTSAPAELQGKLPSPANTDDVTTLDYILRNRAPELDNER
ncbi:MAG TPA: hypothetical protein PKY77_05915 [Phycisphaerae bacterium]|nr:hypothetical protein [Phycisphaerae bacterium]HRY69019.1 hypothetical protein [Phycisphaerae bacterium]HSA26006.1 hypothetical protein [Phycisphaerae bacterium]